MLVQMRLDRPFQMALPTKPVTLEEVVTQIGKLKNKKAPGEDLLDNKTLKILSTKALLFIVLLFNSVLRLSHYPSSWKSAIITMIPKPGKQPTEVDAYRPISLLPALGKMMERAILDRILGLESVSRAIPKWQFGFRKSHGTPEQLHRVVNFALEAMESKMYTVAVFMDIQQAFDRVWHDGLLSKLKILLTPQLFLLIQSFLSERKFSVVVDGEKSSKRPISAGVPQGSVLGPTLYSLYTSDMPDSWGCTEVDDDDMLIATYADDTAVMVRSPSIDIATLGLQEYVSRFEKWTTEWNIGINCSKCACVTFSTRPKNCPGISMFGSVLRHESYYKYLGVILDRGLTFQRHTTMIKQSVLSKAASMSWLLSSRKKLSLSHKVRIYKSILSPIWKYALQVYGIASKTNLNKIRVAQSKIIRSMCNAPWYMRTRDIERDLKIPKIGDVCRTHAENYFRRLGSHPNSLAKRLIWRPTRRRLKRNHPHDLPLRYI